MGQAISHFDDKFLSRLAIWELAQANYLALYRASEAAGDIDPPERVDDAAEACKKAADVAFETEPTTKAGLLAFCKFMQDQYFNEDPEGLQLGYATLARALAAMTSVGGHKAADEDDGRDMPQGKLTLLS